MRMTKIWLLAILYWFLLVELGRSETHHHITRASFDFEMQSFSWFAQQYDEKEKAVGPAVDHQVLAKTKKQVSGNRSIDIPAIEAAGLLESYKVKSDFLVRLVSACGAIGVTVWDLYPFTGEDEVHVFYAGDRYDHLSVHFSDQVIVCTDRDQRIMSFMSVDVTREYAEHAVDAITYAEIAIKRFEASFLKASHQDPLGLGEKDAGAPPEGLKLAGNVEARTR